MKPSAHLALVDDDDSVRRALARLLRAHGWETRCYASGPEFLASLGEARPFCVILDICMPVLNGLEVQAALSRTPFHLPVIFLTSHDDPKTEAKARAGGAVGFFATPVDEAAFFEAITAFCPPHPFPFAMNTIRPALGIS